MRTYLRLSGLLASIIAGLVPQFHTSVASAQTRVVTIGDSWAFLVAPSLQTSMNAFHPGVVVANQSYGGGTAANFAGSLNDITNRVLSAGPDADIVWLSAGGNDMLAGIGGGGWYAQLDPGQRTALYNTIGQNVQTVANHILSIRPDIQVVIEGYDYLNVWDGTDQSTLAFARTNLGIGKSGIPLLDLAQNADLNQAFRDVESRKQAIGDGSSRIHYINNMGFLNTTTGYSGYFGNVPGGNPYPPEVYPALPTSASLMGDPIHLNTTGYNALALRAEQQFFSTALQSGQLALSTTALDFGATRIGTSLASQSVTASNAGLNFTKVEGLTMGNAVGEFSGGGQSFNPLFRDPSLGSDTASVLYGYAPTNRGSDVQQVSISSDNGGGSVTLQGQGVGPEFQASAVSLDLGIAGLNQLATENFSIANVTPDGDLGSLTDLTLLSVQLTGPDAANFNLLGFTPGMVLDANGLASLTLQAAFSTAGQKQATLWVHTDQGAVLGGSGQSFQIPLSLTVVPEPATCLLLGVGAIGAILLSRKRF